MRYYLTRPNPSKRIFHKLYWGQSCLWCNWDHWAHCVIRWHLMAAIECVVNARDMTLTWHKTEECLNMKMLSFWCRKFLCWNETINCFSIKMLSCQYRKSHCILLRRQHGNKTILQSDSTTGRTVCLYKNPPEGFSMKFWNCVSILLLLSKCTDFFNWDIGVYGAVLPSITIPIT